MFHQPAEKPDVGAADKLTSVPALPGLATGSDSHLLLSPQPDLICCVLVSADLLWGGGAIKNLSAQVHSAQPQTRSGSIQEFLRRHC